MINQVTLVGRLTKDPELKKTSEGTSVAQITLAVSRHFRNTNGELEADFVQCTLWRKAAENTVQYCRKGAVIGITGRLQTRNYENRDGKRVYVTEVVAESVRFLSSKPSGGSSGAGSGSVSGRQVEPTGSLSLPGLSGHPASSEPLSPLSAPTQAVAFPSESAQSSSVPVSSPEASSAQEPLREVVSIGF